MIKQGWVYILSYTHHTVLYTGVTSNLRQRMEQHRSHLYPYSFTARYNCTKLVYYCKYADILEAICEEKRIKGGSRKAKELLININNPKWVDLWELRLNNL
ncbi:putative endonuclease [Cnuella takakiae]|uniref:Putative endonuclease n=1 Tax=Cnuella takakiae TaxID=1302690 RepID=A0A1M5A6U6_9BACT|nr:GIY-YIG nuclease family protein [Cnuella takakiae]OLY92070.1 excinuclease ABC subunit C [Cnuella takakiae]SHF26033.1 putative endonuclease [Cnuella takakiae]